MSEMWPSFQLPVIVVDSTRKIVSLCRVAEVQPSWGVAGGCGEAMDQTVYMPGYSSAPAPAPSHGYRGGLGGAAPQGSKLATYMSRGGPQQQQQGYHDISNKMRDMSMLNRPPTPGTVTHNLDTSRAAMNLREVS